MSKDIRSFFQVLNKKKSKSSESTKASKSKKIEPVVVDSDSEDVIEATPKKVAPSKSSKRKMVVLSSDSEDERIAAKAKTESHRKTKNEKLKPVNIDDIFGKPVTQAKVEVTPKPSRSEEKPKQKSRAKKKPKTELGVHEDEDFEKTLLELDDDLLLENVEELDRTIDEAMRKNEADNEEVKNRQTSSTENSPKNKNDNKAESKTSRKRSRESESDNTPKKTKLEHSDSGIDPDQERFEKRRYSAMLYQKYKNRAGPKHHGSKELPQGKPDCLKNLTFIRTGVLDSLESDEFENLVKEHGGRVVNSVSKKVSYIVVGEEPGPSKLDKARGYNIPEISEDELLDMILVKSGEQPKFVRNVSAESGIVIEEDKPVKKEKELKKQKKESQNEVVSEIENKRCDLGTKETKKESIMSDLKPTKPNLKTLSAIVQTNDKVVEKQNEEPKPACSTSKEKEEKLPKSPPVVDTAKTAEGTTPPSPSPTPKEDEKKRPKASIIVDPAKPAERTTPPSLSSSTSKEKEKKRPNAERTTAPSSTIVDVNQNVVSWTDKYKPTTMKAIIGQQDGNSNMNKLKWWLEHWYENQMPNVRKRIPKPSPWAKNDNGAYFKAALLSGPPGVGKTTTATLVCKELGWDVVEFNASDTRSKRLLHEEVSQLLSTTTIAGFAAGNQKTNKKRVLLMDEVDGMAGNEDRGGMQELINLIKITSIPIICMCNDRNHQKMRSLINYCFDLRFNKPKVEQIRGAMMSICFKEGLQLTPNTITEIINGTGCDVRQTLNNLAMWTAGDKNLSHENAKKEANNSTKDTVLGPWEVIRLVFSESEQKKMSIGDRSRLFFYDYSIGPLFVQENYLNVTPKCPSKFAIVKAAQAAEAISMGDIIDAKIRGSNNWALLESEAIFSSVLPGHFMSGQITKRINFPSWLGKNASASKHKRMLSEIHVHTRMSTSGSRLAMQLDYMTPLRNAIINPLREYGVDGVPQAFEVMKHYNLLRDDLTNLIELCQWQHGGAKNPFDEIDPKVKSAFTRYYNKAGPMLPFAQGGGFSKKKASAVDSELMLEEEEEGHEDEGDESDIETDDVKDDAMIKVKTKTEPKSKKDSSKPATSSKAKESTKGKGKAKKK